MAEEIKQPEVETEPQEDSTEVNQPQDTGVDEDDVAGSGVGDTEDPETEGGEEEEASAAKPDPAQFYANQAARLEQELQSLKDNQTRAQREQEERERLAYMTPEERNEYTLKKMREEIKADLEQTKRQTQFMTRDAMDQSKFIANYSNSPLAKYIPEAEKAYQALIRSGVNATREDALALFMGKKALEASKKGVGQRQKTKAVNNIAKSKTQGTSTRSDTAGQKQKTFAANDQSLAAIESRLKGKNIFSQSWGNA